MTYFSICIPCYEMHGKGSQFLERLLQSISTQTFKDYEIIVSDQSSDKEIENLVSKYSSQLPIKYFWCNHKGKSSYNLNNAIKNAVGKIIKPMFQDDYFINDNTLTYIASFPDINFGGVGFTHFDNNYKYIGNDMTPRFNNDIKHGVNTIGGPSVVFFKNDNNYFNDDLVWLMDCEFYHRMVLKYNEFSTINFMGVGVMIWPGSYTNDIPEEIKQKENAIVRGLHG